MIFVSNDFQGDKPALATVEFLRDGLLVKIAGGAFWNTKMIFDTFGCCEVVPPGAAKTKVFLDKIYYSEFVIKSWGVRPPPPINEPVTPQDSAIEPPTP